MSKGSQSTKWRRNIAENFNRLSTVHELKTVGPIDAIAPLSSPKKNTISKLGLPCSGNYSAILNDLKFTFAISSPDEFLVEIYQRTDCQTDAQFNEAIRTPTGGGE